MSRTRHGVYIILCVLIAKRLHVACGARTKRSNNFYTIASRIKTDKVGSHHYEVLYDKYLQPIAGEKLRLLEGKKHYLAVIFALRVTTSGLSPLICFAVGLGCDMSYGPGHSLKVRDAQIMRVV